MVEILEDIARNGQNAAARIAAIRQLREMDDGDSENGEFADLDELAPRRRPRAA
jgi:hypothetical protein